MVSDLVQPAGQGRSARNAAGFPRQGQKRRLKTILGVVEIEQNSPANAEHQSLVPPDEKFERRLVAGGRESLQQLSVVHSAAARERLAKLTEHAG
jgi:hypothetical protein